MFSRYTEVTETLSEKFLTVCHLIIICFVIVMTNNEILTARATWAETNYCMLITPGCLQAVLCC